MQSLLLRSLIVLFVLLSAQKAQCSSPVYFTNSLSEWQAHLPGKDSETTTGYRASSTALGPASISYTAGSVETIGNGWNTWCCGYAGEVVWIQTTKATVDLKGLTAFGFQIEPNIYQVESITVTLSDGQKLTENVGGRAGAQFFGFIGTGITSLTIQDGSDDSFAIGNFFWITDISSLALKRLSLMQVEATATPEGGTFAYTVNPNTGTTNVSVGFASGSKDSTNPNTAQLKSPANPSPTGAPSPGGLATVTTKYTVAAKTQTDAYQVPTFGMSCYDTTLQSDWGVAPNSCSNLNYLGVSYSGSTNNPPGLTGEFCNSFLEDIKIQGSGVLNNGLGVQFSQKKNAYQTLNANDITGYDGSPVIANKTVARDETYEEIIPDDGVYLDLDQVGTDILANDKGAKSRIIGYRLDLYRGIGSAVCKNYKNIMSVATCSPAQNACPASEVK